MYIIGSNGLKISYDNFVIKDTFLLM